MLLQTIGVIGRLGNAREGNLKKEVWKEEKHISWDGQCFKMSCKGTDGKKN